MENQEEKAKLTSDQVTTPANSPEIGAGLKVPPPAVMWPIGYHHPEFTKNYHGTNVPYPFYTVMDAVGKFEARKDDIVICTFPKGGTTWMSAIVEMIRNEGDPKCLHDETCLETKNPYLEFSDPVMPPERHPVHQLATLPHGRVYFTHLGYEALPKSIQASGAKIIYVLRNPKDTVVSMYHFFRSVTPMQFKGSLQDIVDSFTDDSVMYGPYFDHAASYLRQKGKNPNIFFTSFEELSEDFVDVVKRLAKFLGKNLTEDQIHAIFYECAFDQMKNNATINRMILTKSGHFDFTKSPFIRAGKVGNWKSHFSPEQNQQLDSWIQRNLQRPEISSLNLKFRYK